MLRNELWNSKKIIHKMFFFNFFWYSVLKKTQQKMNDIFFNKYISLCFLSCVKKSNEIMIDQSVQEKLTYCNGYFCKKINNNK